KLLASASADQTIKIWDTASGKEVKTLVGHPDVVIALAFSADGKSLASSTGGHFSTRGAGGPDAVKIWDVSTWEEKVTLKDNDGSCVFLAFTADGKTLVTLNSYGDLTPWDFEKLQERKTVKLKRSPPAGIAVSADGKVLALTYGLPVNKGKFNEAKGKVDLLDTATGELLETIPLDTAGQSVAFSAKGAMLAAGTRGKEQYPANLDTIRLGADAEGDLSG